MKKIHLLAIGLFLALFIFTRQASAASFSLTASEDGWVIGNTLVNDDQLVAASFGISWKSLLKFDVASNTKLQSALKSGEITSVKLKLYQEDKQMLPDIKVYYSNDDSWHEGKLNGFPVTTNVSYDKNNIIGSINGADYSWITSDLSITPFKTDSNQVYTIVLADSDWFSWARFASKDKAGGYAPELIIEAPSAPVPEPSSMILGLIGLAGSLSGFSRKKKIH